MSIISIVASVLSLIATIVGDRILAKWVGAARLWWRTKAEASLKEQADAEYSRLLFDWSRLQGDREPWKPGNP